MKAIIKNGVANKDIQSCLISECGVEITFHNNDLADKFALSLNLLCEHYVYNVSFGAYDKHFYN